MLLLMLLLFHLPCGNNISHNQSMAITSALNLLWLYKMAITSANGHNISPILSRHNISLHKHLLTSIGNTFATSQ